jgi:hypothetical protein
MVLRQLGQLQKPQAWTPILMSLLLLVGIRLEDLREIRTGYLMSYVDCSITYPRTVGGRTVGFTV